MKRNIAEVAAAGFITIGLSCFAAFGLIGGTVGEDGLLHEPFALIPLGYIALVLGILAAIIVLILRYRSAAS